MDYIKWLNIDNWWKVVLWLGVSLCIISLLFDIDIVSTKHLLGLSIDLIIIGLSMFGAQVNCVQLMPELHGYAQGHITRHNTITRICLIFGVILTVLFLVLIILRLI
jgi:hypothetical protein